MGWCRLGKNSWRREREEPRKNGPCLHSFPERFIGEQLKAVHWFSDQFSNFYFWIGETGYDHTWKTIFPVKCIGAKLAQS